jgi:predicted small secreted protein
MQYPESTFLVKIVLSVLYEPISVSRVRKNQDGDEEAAVQNIQKNKKKEMPIKSTSFSKYSS